MGILPTLIGLLTAVGVLRASDIFEHIGRILAPVTEALAMAPEILSLIFIKLFFVHGGDRADAGYFYGVRGGFGKWMAFCPDFKQYGKLYLYNVCVFYVPENYKNPVDIGRGADGGSGRRGSKYCY